MLIAVKNGKNKQKKNNMNTTPTLLKAANLANDLKDNYLLMKRLHGPKWSQIVSDTKPSILKFMELTKTTNPLEAILPIAKQMSAAGENPMTMIAVACEISLEH